MPTHDPGHGPGHRRHVGGLIVTLPVGDANGRPATRAAGGAAAPLPLLGAPGRLRCGSACPRQPGSTMKAIGLVGELVTPRGQSRGQEPPTGRRPRQRRGRLRWECRSTPAACHPPRPAEPQRRREQPSSSIPLRPPATRPSRTVTQWTKQSPPRQPATPRPHPLDHQTHSIQRGAPVTSLSHTRSTPTEVAR